MISTEIGVPLHDVEMMEGRLSGSDYSLNATQSTEDEGREWIDALERRQCAGRGKSRAFARYQTTARVAS